MRAATLLAMAALPVAMGMELQGPQCTAGTACLRAARLTLGDTTVAMDPPYMAEGDPPGEFLGDHLPVVVAK